MYALFDVSRLMKWCTRSTEEIFALFISIAFVADAFKDAYKSEFGLVQKFAREFRSLHVFLSLKST